MERKPWSPNTSEAGSESSPMRLQLNDTEEVDENIIGDLNAFVNKDVYGEGSHDPLAIDVGIDEADDVLKLILPESSGEENNAEENQARASFLLSFNFLVMSYHLQLKGTRRYGC
jgi:hypothetical protein